MMKASLGGFRLALHHAKSLPLASISDIVNSSHPGIQHDCSLWPKPARRAGT